MYGYFYLHLLQHFTELKNYWQVILKKKICYNKVLVINSLLLVWRRRPFSFPILVGGKEGKGLVALVSMTCAGTKIVALQSGRSNQIAESLIKRIPQPHTQYAPIYSALLAMEDQVMKSVFRS